MKVASRALQALRSSSTMLLTRSWSRTVAIGWGGLSVALVCTAISSHVIGRPVFWLDDQRWPIGAVVFLSVIVMVPALVTTLVAYMNKAGVPVASCSATSVLVVVSIMDRHSSPGAAVVEGTLALAGLLLTVAAVLGRYRVLPHE